MIALNSSFNQYKSNCDKQRAFSAPISFGMNIRPEAYDYVYSTCTSPFNGEEPDSYILKSIKQYCPEMEEARILDLGSGDGRNTIPIAKSGYQVTGVEMSERGRYVAMENARLANVVGKVSFDPRNLLKRWPSRPLFDYAFLSHVSMHLGNSELQTVFANVNKFLKQRGIFTLNALITKERHHLEQVKEDERLGANHFDRNIITDIATNSGFELVESCKFQERGPKRALFEKCTLWGGNVSALQEHKPRPVELTWFTYRKIAHPPTFNLKTFIKSLLK